MGILARSLIFVFAHFLFILNYHIAEHWLKIGNKKTGIGYYVWNYIYMTYTLYIYLGTFLYFN